jgi:hypothetical protein
MTNIKNDPFRIIAVAIAAASLAGGVWSWADALNDATVVNAQAITNLNEIDITHKQEHIISRAEYREDMKGINEKLDRLLESAIVGSMSE